MRRFLAPAARAAVLPTLTLGLVPPSALPQTVALEANPLPHDAVEVLVQAGDRVPGLGVVVSIGRVAINDAGSWLVEVRTDDPDPARDEAVLFNGAVAWSEGQALVALGSRARIRRVEDFALNAHDDVCWDFTLAGTPGGSEDDSVLFFDTRLVLQEGRTIAVEELPPDTPYRRLLAARLNGAGDVLLLANLRRPAPLSPLERALIQLDLAPDGSLRAERTIALVGDAPAALAGDVIVDVDSAPHALAFNAHGEALYLVRTSGVAGGGYALLKGDELVAREGAPCPVAEGRSWERLRGMTVALNDAGSVLFRAGLDGDLGDDDLLVLDDPLLGPRVLAREGDVLATVLGAYPIRGFAYTTPLGLGNGGDTLYFAFLDKPQAKNVVAVLDGRIVLQEDVTPVGETWIEALIEPPHVEFAALSPDASKLIVECRLAGRGEAALRVDLARLAGRFCNASDVACPCLDGAPLAGCDNAASTGGVRLRLAAQAQGPQNRATLSGSGFDRAVDGSAPAAILLRSDARLDDPRVFGDGYLCLQPPLVRVSTQVAAGGVTRHRIGHGPAAGAGTFYYQLWFRDTPLSYCDPVSGFNLSNGRSLDW